MIRRLRTIDAHVAGAPIRLIVEGCPSLDGPTMQKKQAWLRSRHDWLRRAVMHEPRGHTDMCGAVLTQPVRDESHAGVLFLQGYGYSAMSGHGIIGVVTIALEHGLLHVKDVAGIALDTPAGLVGAKAKVRTVEASPSGVVRVETVTCVNVPAFVCRAALPIRVSSREVRVDIAFGGAFYAIVDSEAAGVGIARTSVPELRRTGLVIKQAVETAIDVVHPLDAGLKGLYGTIFTGPSSISDAHLRSVTMFADGAIDRSPGGTGTSAVMAVLDAMGLLASGGDFVHESLIGTTFRGRVAGRTTVGDFDAVVTEIEGSAWITGEHTFLIDDEDPLKEGFTV